MKIFVTGATGFLGLHITNVCVNNKHEVLCLKRTSSKSLFEPIVEEKIKWVNSDSDSWENEVKNFQPDVLIHSAWGGVSSIERNDPKIQQKNVELTRHLISICSYKQIIALGSQDEYGEINSFVSEDHKLKPLTEYAKAKILCCNFLKEYCQQNNIEWQWIRIFSIFGENQKRALIPLVIKNCLDGVDKMETTEGEQEYAYLYSFDFAKAIMSILGSNGKSGIYNLSSIDSIRIRDILLKIKELTNTSIHFDWGAIPYRKNQSMYLVGDSKKFEKAFGLIQYTDFQTALQHTINSYKEK